MRPHSPARVFLRRIKIVLVTLFSVAAGAVLVGVFAPRAFFGLSTVELASILGMLALPLFTLLAWQADRSDAAAASESAPAPATSVHGPGHLPRVQTHGPSVRRAERSDSRGHEHAMGAGSTGSGTATGTRITRDDRAA